MLANGNTIDEGRVDTPEEQTTDKLIYKVQAQKTIAKLHQTTNFCLLQTPTEPLVTLCDYIYVQKKPGFLSIVSLFTPVGYAFLSPASAFELSKSWRKSAPLTWIQCSASKHFG